MLADLPLVIHQSDLQSWNRCPRELYYDRTLGGEFASQNSASAFGSVVHHAMHVLERDRDLDAAIKTFLYYWHPLNIDAVCPPIPTDGWLPRHHYGELRKRGVDTLRKYADVLRHDDHELLALEYEFAVPIRGLTLNGRSVWLAGTVDRLAVRWYRQRETLCVDDWKTGQQKWNLRHNVQGTAYIYASAQPEFWMGGTLEAERILGGAVTYETPGFAGVDQRDSQLAERLIERFEARPRKFTWINLQSFKWVDGGYRGPQDFTRFKEAAAEVLLSADQGIFPLRMDGETCKFCAFRKHCGVPADGHGDPAYALEDLGSTRR